MDHFLYRDGILHAEDVPLPEIAAELGTPFYCYSTATLTRHYRLFDEALAGMDHLVCYAVKAASNLAILPLFCRGCKGSETRCSHSCVDTPSAKRAGRKDGLLQKARISPVKGSMAIMAPARFSKSCSPYCWRSRSIVR